MFSVITGAERCGVCGKSYLERGSGSCCFPHERSLVLSDRTRQESCTFLIILTELFTVSYKPGSVMGQKTIGCSGMRSSESKLPLLSHFKIMRLVDEHG